MLIHFTALFLSLASVLHYCFCCVHLEWQYYSIFRVGTSVQRWGWNHQFDCFECAEWYVALKVKVEHIWYGPTLSQRCSGMALIFKVSHRFTCHSCVYPRMEWTVTIPAFAFPAEADSHLPTPEGWKAELMRLQSAQDCYVMEITVFSCSDRHASPGNWNAASHERQTIDINQLMNAFLEPLIRHFCDINSIVFQLLIWFSKFWFFNAVFFMWLMQKAEWVPGILLYRW